MPNVDDVCRDIAKANGVIEQAARDWQEENPGVPVISFLAAAADFVARSMDRASDAQFELFLTKMREVRQEWRHRKAGEK